MINFQVLPEMEMQYNFNNVCCGDAVWWFQDGAGPHRRQIVTNRLTALFGDQVVALNRDTEWPTRSLDLTSCDFLSGII